MPQGFGRFAPSPTGPLHLGNLRTALAAWLFARSTASGFRLRIDDLDRTRSRPEFEAQQRADLLSLGLDWDGPIMRQSDRADRYADAVHALTQRDLLFPCFCTRREIGEAASAPHGDPLARRYPGTCRDLTSAQRATRLRIGHPAALRLRAPARPVTVTDMLGTTFTAPPDDVIIVRGDGTAAYNLAVVLDDADQGVTQVVRGHDLLTSAPTQITIAELLGLPIPEYAHVSLMVGADGARLAKRHGAVTLADLRQAGHHPDEIRHALLRSLGIEVPAAAGLAEALGVFDPTRLPTTPTPLAELDGTLRRIV